MGTIEAKIQEFMLTDLLEGYSPDELAPSARLISTGMLDSMAVLKLMLFLENEFSISIDSDEAVADQLDSIEMMARLVESKVAATA